MQPSLKTSTEGAILIRIRFQEKDGWWNATSPDLEGFYVAHQDPEYILQHIPEAIETLYSMRNNVDCKVVHAETIKPERSQESQPWVILPEPLLDSFRSAATA